MPSFSQIRALADGAMRGGLSGREVEKVYDLICDRRDTLPVQFKMQLARFTELYGSYFTGSGVEQWKKLTGIDTTVADSATYPRGFLPTGKVVSLRARLSRERDELQESFGAGRGQPADQIVHRIDGNVVVNRALATAVAEALDNPRITYDVETKTLVDIINEKVGGGFSEDNLNRLRRDYPDQVPDTFTIRRQVIRRICVLMTSLYKERSVPNTVEMTRILADEYDIDLKSPLVIRSFRRHFPDLVPSFKADAAAKYERFLEKLLARLKMNPEVAYEVVAGELGVSLDAVGRGASDIRKRWPGELDKRRGWEKWTAEEVRAVKRAVEDAPLFASVGDIVDILRTQMPTLVERHFPVGKPSSLYTLLRRDLGISDWNADRQKRYAAAFAEVVRRSPPEASLREIAGYMQEEYPGSYGYIHLHRLTQKWRKHAKEYPEVADLADANGTMPWEYARISYSQALAKRVGKEIEAHPGKSLQFYVDRLHQDTAFHDKYPQFARKHISKLRGRYPKLVPYISELQVRGRAKRIAAARNKRYDVARRAAAYADGVRDKRGLTLKQIARHLKVRRKTISRVVNEFPELFAWYRTPEPKAPVDLELAVRVAVELQSMPLGTTRTDILQRLLADPIVAEAYPHLKEGTIHQLRRRYPDLVPDLRVRDQVLRSKRIRDAVLSAPDGQAFAVTLGQVIEAAPDLFSPNWSNPTWVQRLWDGNSERFPFLDELTTRGTLKLSGRGQTVSADDSADIELADRLARLETLPGSLPVIDKIVERSDPQTFGRFEVLCIQHLLGAQSYMFEALRKMGMSRQRTTIVSIPYSESAEVADVLTDKGWDVRSPPLDMAAFEDEVRASMLEKVRAAEQRGTKIVVIDDGGLVSKLLDHDPELKPFAHLFRVVEQTRRGITVADATDLHTSVINVAQSWGKFVEGPMIGDSLYVKCIERLERLGIKSVKGMHVGVVGFGTIGEPWADFLRQQGAIVTVLDASAKTEERARKAGFEVAKNREDFFGKQELVLGGTGVNSITADDIRWLKDGCILGSGSSKLVEIDVDALNEASTPTRGKNLGLPRMHIVDADSQPPTVEYTLNDGRKIRLLARGYPLNFDGSSEIVAHEKIQLTMALLMMGAIQATSSDVAGVARLDPKLQLEVLGYFAEEEVAGEKEIAAALREAQAALAEASLRRGANYRRHG